MEIFNSKKNCIPCTKCGQEVDTDLDEWFAFTINYFGPAVGDIRGKHKNITVLYCFDCATEILGNIEGSHEALNNYHKDATKMHDDLEKEIQDYGIS